MPNLITDYLQFVKGSDECSVYVHRWCVTTALSAFLGRRLKLPFGSFNIYPNLYVKIIGPAGCRKSTGIRKAKKLLQEASTYSSFAFEQTSKEKFIQDLATGAFSQTPVEELSFSSLSSNEVFIVADEFNDFIGANNVAFCSLLGNLWDYEGVYKPSFKNSGTLTIKNPTITLLGGNTHEAMQDAFPPHLIGQGFTSRIIFVSATHSAKKIAWPSATAQSFAKFTDAFNEIEDLFYREIEIAPYERNLIERIYTDYKPLRDNRLAHYCSRRHIQLLKLCIITAASNYRTKVLEEDIIYANTLLTYAESKMSIALGEFGRAKSSPVAMRVLALLSNPPGVKLSTKELWAGGCSHELDNYAQFGDHLNSLVLAGKIKIDKATSKWELNAERENLVGTLIDISLIPEIHYERH